MNIIKKFLKRIYIRYSVFRFCLYEYRYLISNLGSSDTFGKKEKIKYSLLLQSHVIEKGLSLKDVKIGFGIPKILNLLNNLNEYMQKYDDHETLFFVLSIVKQYMVFHESNNVSVDSRIERLYNELAGKFTEEDNSRFLRYCGGVETKSRQEVSGEGFDYENFIKSRHSIRTFTGEAVPEEVIRHALEMAEMSPSACNRQPWLVYVRSKKENVLKILDLQTGARQFKEQVAAIVIVASTANAFSITEAHQPYLNGGLYAMNLMLAFHSLGVGTIPLNLGIDNGKIQSIRHELGMPDDALPVLMLAIGQIPETLKVACSRRFSFEEYTDFD